MSALTILALDLSLTATGYARGPLPAGPAIEGSAAPVEPPAADRAVRAKFGRLSPPAAVARGMERLGWIRSRVLELAESADVVVLEGYGFAPGRGNAGRELAELGGVVRLALHDVGAVCADVAPATLKKYATGRGNAPKEEVLAAAIRRRLGYPGHDDNEADVLWLWHMAAEHYGLITSPVPRAQREAASVVRWPSLTRMQREAACA